MKPCLTKRAPDAGDSGAIPSIFLRLIIFPVGRRPAARPSAGNASRWAVPSISKGDRMDSIQQVTNVVCPFCNRTSFNIEVKGKIFKSTIFTCQTCDSVMETKNDKDFKIITVGGDYSNTQTFMKDKVFPRDKLSDIGLPLFSDAQLSEVSNGEGELFEQFISQPFQNTPVILKQGERLLLNFNNIVLSEERSQRSSGSFSFRVTKGVWFHTGRIFQPGSSIQQIDIGTFAVTDKRYVFVGGKKSVDQSLSKITTIQPFSDGFGVSRSNKQKIEYYSGTYHFPLISSLFMGIIKKYGQP
jgi:hypothetical protein